MRAVRGMLIFLIAGALAISLGVAPLRVAQAAGLSTTAWQSSGVARDGSGAVIIGQVVNGSQNNTAVAGQSVILQFSVGTTIHDLRTVATDRQGRFSFANVAPTVAVGQNYAVYTHFQGGVYSSAPIQLKAGATQQAQIVVYTATQNPANLSVSVATILFRDIDQQHQLHGLVSFGEFLTIQNSGKTAFVGSFAQPAGGGMPGALRFALPPNAINLTTGVGFFNTQIIQLDGVFASTATVPPGETQFAFSFDVPYSGTTFAFPYVAQYPTTQVVALVPPDMLVRSNPGFQAQQPVEAFGGRYQVFTVNSLAAQGQATVNLWDLPQAGEQPDLNFTQLVWLAVALAMIIAILLVFYLRRGDLAVALGLVPARAIKAERAAQASARRMSLAEREAERKRLLRRLLALEHAHQSGALADAAYRQQRAETRAALKAVLALELPTPKAAVQTAPAPRAESSAPPTATTVSAAADEQAAPSDDAQTAPRASRNAAPEGKRATEGAEVAPTAGKRAAKSTPSRALSGGRR